METTSDSKSSTDTESSLMGAILRRVRIDLVRTGRVTQGNIVDLETGRSICCRKIEFVHEVGKRPNLVITCSPMEIHYSINDMPAEIQAIDRTAGDGEIVITASSSERMK